MLDTEEQLARLRQRIAAINHKFSSQPSPKNAAAAAPAREPLRLSPEDWPGSEVITNEFGEHLQMERLYPHHKRHGSADIGALCELPHDLFAAIGAGQIAPAAPQRWAFLDTETTGLSGGSGTYAFLIGVGRITPEGFRVRQFFMREYAEERSLLAALNEHLSEFDVLITYNGKSYDQPLLETRYRMTRGRPPFDTLSHLDLLYGARRIWKLRLESCRLIELEQQILGFHREGDIPGHLIPYIYFEYLRSRETWRLVPVFYHNALDIVTLACLTAIVPAAFRGTDAQSLARLGIRRGEDLTGIARWLLAAGDHERAGELMRHAVDVGLPEPLLFDTLWNIALLEKKQKRHSAALSLFTELASCPNRRRIGALEELAKHYEHKSRDHALALQFTEQALRLQSSESLARRKARLESYLEKPRTKQLL